MGHTNTSTKGIAGVAIVTAVLALGLMALLFEAAVNLGLSHLVSGIHPITFWQSLFSLFALRIAYVAMRSEVKVEQSNG